MKRVYIGVALLALLVIIIGCSKPSITTPDSASMPASTVTATTTIVSTTSITDVINNTIPAVVRVITQSGMGSGIIIDEAGYVLTNNHVIEGNETASVVLNNGQQLIASILGRDEITDLAILKFSGENLPVVTFGDSDKLVQGEEVIAIGYPLDLMGSASISRGIVSALRNEGDVDYIQTDAAINPGSSGGALINLDGEVVGINVLTIRVVEGLPIEGMNFAIAVNSAKPIIPRLVAGESILKPTPEQEPWLTFINYDYGYSIQYPRLWTLGYSEAFPNQVLIDGPGYYTCIIINPPYKRQLGDTVSSEVDRAIDAGSEITTDYRVLSRIELMWRGMYPACEWTEMYRNGPNAPLNIVKNLLIKSNDYFYEVRGAVYELEYELYSATINAIIDSYNLIE
jgi:S1-C subfamily serine protease